MSKSKKLVFFGNERLTTGISHTDTPTIKSLINNGYEVAAVVSNYIKGRSRNARKLEITEVAEHHNIPVLLPTHPIDIKHDIKNMNADFGVLVAYGRIIPQEIIDVFPHGIINIHPSLLPKYRGPTPIEQVILDDAEESGTSIMRLVKEMDAGPVYAQERTKLSGNETKEELAEKLLQLGGRLLMDSLPGILNGTLSPTPQDVSLATYTHLLKKEDGIINWDKPAEALERQVRAHYSFPKSHAVVFGQDIIITKARVTNAPDDGDLVLECNPGWLEVQELTAPSGRKISGAEFIRGYSKN
jgi:methionyl-tRNA formyltransferase